jgi:hypothetical protein
MEPRRSVRAEAKATELAANPKADEVQAPAKPKPKPAKQKAADLPPDTWEFPTEGGAIEVEVDSGSGSTTWEKATVIAVLVDGTFQARIKTKDDQWEDWFTWREEGADWRRPGSKAATQPRRRSSGPKVGKLRLRVDHERREASVIPSLSARQRANGGRPSRGQKPVRLDIAEGSLPYVSVDESLVGQRVRCLCSDLSWARGLVVGFNNASRRHTVKFDRVTKRQPEREVEVTLLDHRVDVLIDVSPFPPLEDDDAADCFVDDLAAVAEAGAAPPPPPQPEAPTHNHR